MADKDQAEQAAPEEQQGPGETLREAREAQDLSLEEIAADLRIEAHLLEALEAGRYGELGAPVFARGYIRQYSARLGLDGSDLVERYSAAVGSDDVQVAPSQGIRLRDTRRAGNWIIAAMVLAIIAVALLVWWLYEPASRREAVNPAAVASTPDGRIESGESAAAEDSASVAGPAATERAADETTIADNATPGGSNVDTAEDDPADVGSTEGDTAESDTAESDTAESDTAEGDRAGAVAPDAAAAPSGPGIDVEIGFTDDCWVEISDASGSRLFYGLAQTGDRRVLRGVPPLEVFLGNADAAAILVNGREFTVPAQARRGNLARFAIEAD